MKPIPYGRQSISEEDIVAVTAVLKSDFLTQGPEIPKFEENFARLVGAKYAVAVSNGTAALHLCALALGVKTGSKVLVTPMSFAATSNCVLYCGGEVEFVDIDPNTLLMDTALLEKTISANPKGTYSGVIATSFTGYPLDTSLLRDICDKHGVWVVEDACHSVGGYSLDSKKLKIPSGSSQKTDLAAFSFHPVKHLTTGEGGMVTTSDKALYEKLLMLRTHGITKDPGKFQENHGGWYHEMQELGFNYRMTDIQAALGDTQLKKQGPWLERRKLIAEKYDKAFKGTKILPAPTPEYDGHAYHLYVIQVGNRKEVFDFLKEKNIYSQVHYIPTHLMPYYQKLGWKKGDLPMAEKFYEKCLSLPMFPTLEDFEQDYVIECVLKAAR